MSMKKLNFSTTYAFLDENSYIFTIYFSVKLLNFTYNNFIITNEIKKKAAAFAASF